MRNRAHWTPRYLLDRAADRLYQLLHPDAPWLTPQAIRILDRTLRRDQRGLEFGSGRSTLWLAKRLGRLTSVEHNPQWYQKVKRKMEYDRVGNVDYHFAAQEENPDGLPAYVRIADEIPNRCLSLVLVDGIYRDLCVLAAVPKLRAGGLLVIDNVNRHLPSGTRAPYSRTPATGPDGPGWEQVAAALQGWPLTWTSNGVFDTAIYVKP
ncbi:MAG: class I SAM-dependent methyltransferase [Anaerolineales bacterium]|nr:class I SAM-dependent methyltransferase [Anaerolineales bacterium]